MYGPFIKDLLKEIIAKKFNLISKNPPVPKKQQYVEPESVVDEFEQPQQEEDEEEDGKTIINAEDIMPL